MNISTDKQPLHTACGDAWFHPNGNGKHPSGKDTTTPADGCTLAEYAAAKKLTVEFLKTVGLSDCKKGKQPAVRIPHLDATGKEIAVCYRIDVNARPHWGYKETPCLYGLYLLAKETDYTIICEGQSDCHTLWYNEYPAIGLPGAAGWHESDHAPLFDNIKKIYVIVEPDSGGQALLKWLSASKIRDRVYLIFFSAKPAPKDPSALYLSDPERFKERMNAAMAAAIPYVKWEADQRERARADAWGKCSDLAATPNILDLFIADLKRCGVVGEERNAKLLYLAIVSRVFDKPVSVAVKGPSSAGKSSLVERTLNFFPKDAYCYISGVSERVLAYDTESLVHKMMFLSEASGLYGDYSSFLMRTLLSENRIVYKTVESTKEGLIPKTIIREGPTGLLVTTIRVKIDFSSELETRLLSLSVEDTRAQTRAIIDSYAAKLPVLNYSKWYALQTWLAAGSNKVVIPYADKLMRLIPEVATRLRRDAKTLLRLIEAHALLHQASRQRNEAGEIVATIDDYSVLYELLKDLFSENIESNIPQTVRQTVQAVKEIKVGMLHGNYNPITVATVARKLGLDKMATKRRVASAVDGGYLKNLAPLHKHYELDIGEQMSDDIQVLPKPLMLLRRRVVL